MNLPPEYVPVLRQKLRRVVKRMHADYSAEIEAAYARGVAEGRDEVVVGLKALAKLNGSGAAVMDMARVVKAAAHAPAGGVTVQGKEYRGGEFIPGEVMENATKEEKDAVHGAKGKAKEPHEMTREEWDVEFEKGRPSSSGSHRSTSASAIGRSDKGARDALKAHLEKQNALKAGLGDIDAVTGEPWDEKKHGEDGFRRPARHADVVRAALESGKTVPAHVLADYPDLAEKYPQAAQRGSNVGTSNDENPTKVAQSPAIRTVERTRKLLASDKPLSQVIAAVQQQLEGHTHAELAEIKAHLGIKAGGAKAEMARKIAERAASVDKTNRRHYTHQAMSVDQVHDLIQSHKDNGTLDTADGIRSVVQAIGTGLTVKQVAELKQRLGIKAGGAKHEMATKIALRAAQEKKPEVVEQPTPAGQGPVAGAKQPHEMTREEYKIEEHPGWPDASKTVYRVTENGVAGGVSFGNKADAEKHLERQSAKSKPMSNIPTKYDADDKLPHEMNKGEYFGSAHDKKTQDPDEIAWTVNRTGHPVQDIRKYVGSNSDAEHMTVGEGRELLRSLKNRRPSKQRDEYIRQLEEKVPDTDAVHRNHVEGALSRGLAVPSHVMKQYPDLAAKYSPTTPSSSAPTLPAKPELVASAANKTTGITVENGDGLGNTENMSKQPQPTPKISDREMAETKADIESWSNSLKDTMFYKPGSTAQKKMVAKIKAAKKKIGDTSETEHVNGEELGRKIAGLKAQLRGSTSQLASQHRAELDRLEAMVKPSVAKIEGADVEQLKQNTANLTDAANRLRELGQVIRSGGTTHALPTPTTKQALPTTDHTATAAGLNKFIDSLPGGKATKVDLDAALAPLDSHDKGQLLEIAKATSNDGGLSAKSSRAAILKQIKENMGRLWKTSHNVLHDDNTGDLEHAKREAAKLTAGANGGGAKQPHEMTKAELLANNREDHEEHPDVGSWRMVEGTGELEQLKTYDPHKLELKEEIGNIKDHPTYPEYVQRAKNGEQPPPVMVVDGPNGMPQSSGRRRTLAAREAGTTLRGWHYQRVPGTYSAKTHEEYIADALASGKAVPLKVLAEYPELAAKYGKKSPRA